MPRDASFLDSGCKLQVDQATTRTVQVIYFAGTWKHPLAPAVKVRNSTLHIILLKYRL